MQGFLFEDFLHSIMITVSLEIWNELNDSLQVALRYVAPPFL
jgi:hypothetical protein